MGLDMYLKASKYVAGYDFLKEDEKKQFKGVVATIGAEDLVCEGTPSLDVSITIGYWRKDNHIHNWFVNACGDGVDDCKEIYVTEEEVDALISVCNRVIADKDLAESLLPTKSGFFFGPTEYDSGYFDALGKTVQILEKAKVAISRGYEIYYRASW